LGKESVGTSGRVTLLRICSTSGSVTWPLARRLRKVFEDAEADADAVAPATVSVTLTLAVAYAYAGEVWARKFGTPH